MVPTIPHFSLSMTIMLTALKLLLAKLVPVVGDAHKFSECLSAFVLRVQNHNTPNYRDDARSFVDKSGRIISEVRMS